MRSIFGNLSTRLIQYGEDIIIELDQPVGRGVEELRNNNNASAAPRSNRLDTQSLISFIEEARGTAGDYSGWYAPLCISVVWH